MWARPPAGTTTPAGAVASRYAASNTGTTISICSCDGPICAAPACSVVVAPGYGPSIPGTVVMACGIVTMPGRAASPMGAPCTLSSVCLSADATVTVGETPTVGSVITSAPLLPSVALADP
jgi:hypothetical protein